MPPAPLARARQPPPNNKPALNMSSESLNPSQWLNFSLPPRQQTGVPGSGAAGVPRRSRRGEGWRGSALSRERFVHASFRFVLKPNEMLSFGAHFADPDISLHWPNILQVLVPTFSPYSVAQGHVSTEEVTGGDAETRRRIEEEHNGRTCPICLSKPVAGRMTKCGHIFCFPCILHYIQLSDIPKSAKCPICGDTIHEGMLKSVKYLDASDVAGPSSAHLDGISTSTPDHTHVCDNRDHDNEHPGIIGEMDGEHEPVAPKNAARIHMRLIHRPQMTTLALPASSTWPSDAVLPLTAPWHFLPDVLTYSHIMLATPGYMFAELERELKELKAEWDMLRGDDLGRDFVRVAREKVERQVDKVRTELLTDFVKKTERESRVALSDITGERVGEQPSPGPSRMATSHTLFVDRVHNPNVDIPPNLPIEPNPMPAKKSRRRGGGGHTFTTPTPIPSGPGYWFYQSSLGANVFLHPLDTRILLAHFKSYSAFPHTLTVTAAGLDPDTINDELRKRCKYLSHLATGTEVVFVEAELEDVVGKQGLVGFEQPLKARRDKRRAKAKREDKAKSRWEKAERDKVASTTMTSTPSRTPAEDREFALALERSTAEALWASEPLPGQGRLVEPGSVGSSSSHGSSRWGAAPGVGGGGSVPRSFASTLTRLNTSVPAHPDREATADGWEVDAAWGGFGDLTLEERGGGTAKERGGGAGAGGGSGKKGGKKNKKQTLVLGGGGGRRA